MKYGGTITDLHHIYYSSTKEDTPRIFILIWYESCSLQMMQLWQHTQRKLLINCFLNQQPQEDKRDGPRCEQHYKHHHSWPYSRFLSFSPIQVPLFPPTCPWTLNWTNISTKQQQPWLVWQGRSWKTTCWPSKLGCKCIRPACSAHCPVAVKHGAYTHARRVALTVFTWATPGKSWESPSKTASQTRPSLNR